MLRSCPPRLVVLTVLMLGCAGSPRPLFSPAPDPAPAPGGPLPPAASAPAPPPPPPPSPLPDNLCETLTAVLANTGNGFEALVVADPAQDGEELALWTSSIRPNDASSAMVSRILGSGTWTSSWSTRGDPERQLASVHERVVGCEAMVGMAIEPPPTAGFAGKLGLDLKRDVRFRWTSPTVSLEIEAAEEVVELRVYAKQSTP